MKGTFQILFEQFLESDVTNLYAKPSIELKSDTIQTFPIFYYNWKVCINVLNFILTNKDMFIRTEVLCYFTSHDGQDSQQVLGV